MVEISLKISNFKNGIYRFLTASGIGKTYFGDILNFYAQAYDKKYAYISYNKLLSEKHYIDMLTSDKYDLIFLDRFDRYSTPNIVKTLNDLSKYTTIIVDMKRKNDGLLVSGLANVKYGVNSMEVYRC